jgi:putative oxidoreductase
MVTAAELLYFGAAHLKGTVEFATAIPHLLAIGTGLFLLLGLWTPVAGTLLATIELSIALSSAADAWAAIILAALGASLAMIGPGAWSIDARLFGRRHIGTSPQGRT